jgi:hypothetical protein
LCLKKKKKIREEKENLVECLGRVIERKEENFG